MLPDKQVSKQLEYVVSEVASDLRSRAEKYGTQTQYANYIYKQKIWRDIAKSSIRNVLYGYLDLSFVYRISNSHKVEENLDRIGSLMAVIGYTQKEANILLKPIENLEPKFVVIIRDDIVPYYESKTYKDLKRKENNAPKVKKKSHVKYY